MTGATLMTSPNNNAPPWGRALLSKLAGGGSGLKQDAFFTGEKDISISHIKLAACTPPREDKFRRLTPAQCTLIPGGAP